MLNEKGIKSPSAYRYEKGIVKNERMRGTLWKIYAIEDMLRDEVYLGNMVRGKTHSAMHRGEKRHRVPRSEWTIVEGTHEPIISKELFDAVQAVNEMKTQEHKERLEKATEHPKRDNLLKGKIFCGDCGITMGYTVSGQDSMSYYCPNYKENGAIGCVKKRISAKKLEKALTAVIQTHLKMFMENKTAIQLKNSDAETEKKREALEQEITELGKKKIQCQQKISSLYLDHKEKLLSVQEYFMLKDKYQVELAEIEADCKEKEQLFNEMQKEYGDNMELAHVAERCARQMTISREMVDSLIERVEVYAEGRIQVVFRFADEYQRVQYLREKSTVSMERNTYLEQEAEE